MAISKFVITGGKGGKHKLCHEWEIVILKSHGTESG